MDRRKVDDTLTTANLAFQVIGGALAAYMAWRILVGPDKAKMVKMAIVRSAARFSKVQGERLTSLGNKLDSEYFRIAS